MTSHQNNEHTFWSGYAFGIASATILAYLIGTTNGRTMLTKLMKLVEEVENDPEKLASFLQSLGNSLPFEDTLSSHVKTTNSNNLDSVLKKVKNVAKISTNKKK